MRRAAPPLLPTREPLEITVLDLPLFDQGPAHQPHVAAFARPWPGAAAVYRASGPDSYAYEGQIERPATMGVLTADMPAGAPHRWMRGDGLRVRLFGGALASRDATSVLRGANTAAIEAAPGVWEVLQFAEATLIDRDEYRLDGLLRGQAGAEPFIGAPTPSGARFVLLDAALRRLELTVDEIGLPVRYRIGPAHLGMDDPSYREIVVTSEAVGLRPYVPAHLSAQRDEAGDFSITWVRRTRRGGDVWGVVEPPLAEERERYRVEILREGVVARSFETDAPSTLYTAAMRAKDNVSGPFTVFVAQISASTGPGPAARMVIDG